MMNFSPSKRGAAIAFGLLIFPASAFAQKREYFADDRYERVSALPISMTAEYYDRIARNKALWDMTFDEWFNGPHATAHWGGLRTDLENMGIIPDLSYICNFAANPTGGMSRGADFSSSFHAGFAVNFEKLTGWSGFKGWHLENSWGYKVGDSLSQKHLRNEFDVQQNYGDPIFTMGNLYLVYESKAFDDELHFALRFGRLSPGDDFISKPVYWLYMNSAFNGNPAGVSEQSGFPSSPGNTWGAYMAGFLKNGLYAKAGVYQMTDPARDTPQRHGMYWSFDSVGVNFNAEAGWDINHDDSGKSPANVSVGAVMDWADYAHLDDPSETSRFNTSLYFQADCMVWNMGLPDRSRALRRADKSSSYRDIRGLILWGVLVADPYDELARMPLYFNAGVVFNAPFESRPDDALAFGVAYGKYSQKLQTPESGRYEAVLELNYKAQISRFLFVQPDIQYVLNTAGGQYPDALVLGAQMGVSF